MVCIYGKTKKYRYKNLAPPGTAENQYLAEQPEAVCHAQVGIDSSIYYSDAFTNFPGFGPSCPFPPAPPPHARPSRSTATVWRRPAATFTTPPSPSNFVKVVVPFLSVSPNPVFRVR